MNLQPISSTILSTIFEVTPQRILEIADQCQLDSNEYTTGTKPRFFSPTAIRKIFNRRGVVPKEKRVICFANNKGGVGKSSCAINTASMLSSMGFKILLIDGDPQSNLTSFLLNNPNEIKGNLLNVVQKPEIFESCIINVALNLDLLPSDLNNEHLVLYLSQTPHRNILKKLIEPLKYDFIIWDCNPSISVLNQNIYLSCTDIFIVTAAEQWGHDGVLITHQLIETLFDRETKPNVNVLINKVEMRLNHQGEMIDKLTSYGNDIGLNTYPILIESDSNIPKFQMMKQIPPNKSRAYNSFAKFCYKFLKDNCSEKPISNTAKKISIENNLSM
jgi:chromosome partitioning protein